MLQFKIIKVSSWFNIPLEINPFSAKPIFGKKRKKKKFFQKIYSYFSFYARESNFKPFASIGRTGTSNAKVKVMVICLNISSMT